MPPAAAAATSVATSSPRTSPAATHRAQRAVVSVWRRRHKSLRHEVAQLFAAGSAPTAVAVPLSNRRCGDLQMEWATRMEIMLRADWGERCETERQHSLWMFASHTTTLQTAAGSRPPMVSESLRLWMDARAQQGAPAGSRRSSPDPLEGHRDGGRAAGRAAGREIVQSGHTPPRAKATRTCRARGRPSQQPPPVL